MIIKVVGLIIRSNIVLGNFVLRSGDPWPRQKRSNFTPNEFSKTCVISVLAWGHQKLVTFENFDFLNEPNNFYYYNFPLCDISVVDLWRGQGSAEVKVPIQKNCLPQQYLHPTTLVSNFFFQKSKKSFSLTLEKKLDFFLKISKKKIKRGKSLRIFWNLEITQLVFWLIQIVDPLWFHLWIRGTTRICRITRTQPLYWTEDWQLMLIITTHYNNFLLKLLLGLSLSSA